MTDAVTKLVSKIESLKLSQTDKQSLVDGVIDMIRDSKNHSLIRLGEELKFLSFYSECKKELVEKERTRKLKRNN